MPNTNTPAAADNCGSCARATRAPRNLARIIGAVRYCHVHAVYVRTDETPCPHFERRAAPAAAPKC